MAYVYTEQDDLDLTYFIDYNIRKIESAMEEFETYIKNKRQDNKKMSLKGKNKYNLNDRQIKLLKYLKTKKDEYTTPTIHKNIYQVSKVTAIADLKKLTQIDFLRKEKIGRSVHYYPTEKISELIK